MSKKTLMACYKSFIVNSSIDKALINKILIIETEEDPLVPLQLQIELKNSYPNAKVVTLSKDDNHFPYLTRSNEYNRILIDFLE
jgi:pimeloyl-ACP methyl ester carboxylesterase